MPLVWESKWRRVIGGVFLLDEKEEEEEGRILRFGIYAVMESSSFSLPWAWSCVIHAARKFLVREAPMGKAVLRPTGNVLSKFWRSRWEMPYCL